MSDFLYADGGWPSIVGAELAAGRSVVMATVIAVQGSAPRDVGARMVIGASAIWGTIGGGQLEFDVMQWAREMGADATLAPWARREETAALGPDLGQCCGGTVRVLLERFDPVVMPALEELSAADYILHPRSGVAPLRAATTDERPVGAAGVDAPAHYGVTKTDIVAPRRLPTRPVFVYGAGHVGRALVGQLVPLGLDVHWVDFTMDRFPATPMAGVSYVPATALDVIASHAPADAFHIVMTYSHAVDEAICAAVLKRGQFARLGLIGSQTKAARFRRRLGAMGIAETDLDRVICPIGLAQITGKSPPRVALSIAAGVAIWQQECATQPAMSGDGSFA